jgi:O-antigen/teichoic acid export membrane protein
MASDLKSIAKHGTIYSAGRILSNLISFLMIPVYTNFLTPAEYGVLELLSLTIDVISTLVGIGMSAAVMRYFYSYDDIPSQNRVVSSAMLGTMTIMGVVSATSIIFSPHLSHLVFSESTYASHFRVMFITMFLSSGIEIPMVFLRAKLRSSSVVIISLVKLTMQLSMNIFFLTYLRLGVMGVLYSNLIASFLIGSYLVIKTFRETGIGFSFQSYKQMINFGAPLIIADLSIFLLTYADRYFLKHYGDLTSVGLYAMAYKFGMLLATLFNGPFWSVWSAKMFEIAKRADGKRFFGEIMTYFYAGSLLISLGLSIFTKDVLRIIADQSYWSAYKIVPIISASYVVAGVISIAGAGILVKSKTKYKALSTSTAMVVNIALNFLLIPKWGGYGAAYATLLSFLVRLGVDAYFSQKLFPVIYEWTRIIPVTGIYLMLIIVNHFVQVTNVMLSVVVNLGIFSIFPILLYFSGLLSSDEKRFVKSLVSNPIRSLRSIRA